MCNTFLIDLLFRGVQRCQRLKHCGNYCTAVASAINASFFPLTFIGPFPSLAAGARILLHTGGEAADNSSSVSFFRLTDRRRVHSLDRVEDVPFSHFHRVLLFHVLVQSLLVVFDSCVVDPPVGEVVVQRPPHRLHVQPA